MKNPVGSLIKRTGIEESGRVLERLLSVKLVCRRVQGQNKKAVG